MLLIIEVGQISVSLTGDSPQASFESSARASANLHALRHLSVSPTRALVEVYRRVGGIPQRAVIGGSWTGTTANVLEIGVSLSAGSQAHDGAIFPGAFGRDFATGIPDEFGIGVLRGLLDVWPAAGVIEIDRGASDEVESSPVAFELAAGVLAAALGCAQEERPSAVRRALRELV